MKITSVHTYMRTKVQSNTMTNKTNLIAYDIIAENYFKVENIYNVCIYVFIQIQAYTGI